MTQRNEPNFPSKQHEPIQELVSVVVPLYQSHETVPDLLKAVYESLLPQLREIILVNDGSQDVDAEYFLHLKSSFPLITVLSHNQNQGQNAAIDTGIRNAKGNLILIMDCDLQDPPAEALKLIRKALDTNADAILSVRKNRAFGFRKNIVSVAYYVHYSFFAGCKYAQNTGSMVLIDSELQKRLLQDKYNNVPYVQRIKKHATKYHKVKVQHNSRVAGKSSYTIRKRLTLAFDSYFIAHWHLFATTLITVNLIVCFMFATGNNQWLALFFIFPILNTVILVRNLIFRKRFSRKAEYQKWV